MELCLSAKVLHSSPLAPYFLGKPQPLWDGWDNIVAALGRKVSPRRRELFETRAKPVNFQ